MDIYKITQITKGIKHINHIVKLWERVNEWGLKKWSQIILNQFSFMFQMSTLKTIATSRGVILDEGYRWENKTKYPEGDFN